MCVSGLPVRNGNKHAGEIATMALELLSAIMEMKVPHLKNVSRVKITPCKTLLGRRPNLLTGSIWLHETVANHDRILPQNGSETFSGQ